jgi:hypothetical protein
MKMNFGIFLIMMFVISFVIIGCDNDKNEDVSKISDENLTQSTEKMAETKGDEPTKETSACTIKSTKKFSDYKLEDFSQVQYDGEFIEYSCGILFTKYDPDGMRENEFLKYFINDLIKDAPEAEVTIGAKSLNYIDDDLTIFFWYNANDVYALSFEAGNNQTDLEDEFNNLLSYYKSKYPSTLKESADYFTSPATKSYKMLRTVSYKDLSLEDYSQIKYDGEITEYTNGVTFTQYLPLSISENEFLRYLVNDLMLDAPNFELTYSDKSLNFFDDDLVAFLWYDSAGVYALKFEAVEGAQDIEDEFDDLYSYYRKMYLSTMVEMSEKYFSNPLHITSYGPCSFARTINDTSEMYSVQIETKRIEYGCGRGESVIFQIVHPINESENEFLKTLVGKWMEYPSARMEVFDKHILLNYDGGNIKAWYDAGNVYIFSYTGGGGATIMSTISEMKQDFTSMYPSTMLEGAPYFN